MTDDEVAEILTSELYASESEAVAAAKALCPEDAEVHIHAIGCEIDSGECSCEPIVVTRTRLPSA